MSTRDFPGFPTKITFLGATLSQKLTYKSNVVSGSVIHLDALFIVYGLTHIKARLNSAHIKFEHARNHDLYRLVIIFFDSLDIHN